MAGIYASNMSFDVHVHYPNITYHFLRISSLLASTATGCWLHFEEKNKTYLANAGTARICKNDNTNIL